jgi:hypothetical protein
MGSASLQPNLEREHTPNGLTHDRVETMIYQSFQLHGESDGAQPVGSPIAIATSARN